MDCLITGSLPVPTYVKYGFAHGSGGTNKVLTLNLRSPLAIIGIIKGTISFAVFEVTNFIGGHLADRISFLRAHIWLAPIVLFLFILSLAQGIYLIVCWFRKLDEPDWRAIKYLVLFNIVVIYFSFFFSIKPPQSNQVQSAIDGKDYRILGERRPNTLY